MAMVLVGAINVASMETVWAGVVTPPYGGPITRWRYPPAATERAVTLTRGAEMGRFNMGSTVIVLFPDQTVEWADAIRPEAAVRMGQTLARPVGPEPRAVADATRNEAGALASP
jgi:phosphatidylserine decarboxylase